MFVQKESEKSNLRCDNNVPHLRTSGIFDQNRRELFVGDRVTLFGALQGTVAFECGAYGIAFDETIDWRFIDDQISEMTECGNQTHFCRNDNFVSFWELLWNLNGTNNVCDAVTKSLAI